MKCINLVKCLLLVGLITFTLKGMEHPEINNPKEELTKKLSEYFNSNDFKNLITLCKESLYNHFMMGGNDGYESIPFTQIPRLQRFVFRFFVSHDSSKLLYNKEIIELLAKEFVEKDEKTKTDDLLNKMLTNLKQVNYHRPCRWFCLSQ